MVKANMLIKLNIISKHDNFYRFSNTHPLTIKAFLLESLSTEIPLNYKIQVDSGTQIVHS